MERHTDLKQYKANRQEAPEDLTAAIPDIKRIIRGLNIPIREILLQGFFSALFVHLTYARAFQGL
jgi:hypothetical protein